MSGSSSSPTNTTQTQTTASETNVSAANTSGVTILGSKGVNLTCSRSKSCFISTMISNSGNRTCYNNRSCSYSSSIANSGNRSCISTISNSGNRSCSKTCSFSSVNSGNRSCYHACTTNTTRSCYLSDSNNRTNTTYNVSTDQGAVSAAVGLGSAAIAANQGLSESIATCSFNFGNHALDVLSASQVQSASLLQNFLAMGGAELNQAESGFISLESQSEQARNAQLGNFSATLANIAEANSTSQATQSTNFARTALFIAAGAAVLIVLLTRK